MKRRDTETQRCSGTKGKTGQSVFICVHLCSSCGKNHHPNLVELAQAATIWTLLGNPISCPDLCALCAFAVKPARTFPADAVPRSSKKRENESIGLKYLEIQ